MRKSFKHIFAALAATAALLACTKETTPPHFENDKVNPEGSRVIAVSFASQTKTILDGFQPRFEDGKDTVLISNTMALDTCVVSVDKKTDKATISTNLTGPLTAVYPYKAAKMNDSKTTQIDTVLVSTVQSGKFADANICMAKMKDEKDESLSFENKTAVFCIKPPTNSPGYVEVSAEGFDIANYIPTGSTNTDSSAIRVAPVTTDSVYVSILVPDGLKVSNLKFSDGTKEKAITDAKAATTIVAGTLYTVDNENWESPEADIPGALKGKFSVSADKQVQFSQGNLQATYNSSTSTYTWGFAANQYDYIGNAAGNTSIDSQTDDAVVDLFGWSTDATSNNWGIHTKMTATDGFTTGNFNDWGSQIGDDSTWRTLSKDEWKYLFNSRSNASSLYKCGVTVCSKANCVVLLPDNWDGTVISLTNFAAQNTYDESSNPKWSEMEAAGAVCLPAAGYRNGSNVYDVGVGGDYWSSAAYDESDAYTVDFNSIDVSPDLNGARDCGFSVRLVTDVSAAPFFGIEWEDIVSGTYVSAATHAVILDNLPGKEIPTVLQQRKDQPSTYRLRNVFGDGMHLIINAIDQFDEDDGGKYQFLRIPVQNTGLIYASYGAISVRDIGYWQGDDSYITESGYESGMYEDHSCFFMMQWFVSVGSIGYNWYDYFVPDEE